MNINNINEAFSRIVKEEFDNQTDDNKTVIYKENGVYKTTSKANYDAQIQDARKIQTLYDFESAREIMDYYNKYFNTTDDDFIILDECTNSLKEAPEKKERAPRRPKKLFEDSLYDEVYARLSDTPIYDFQRQPSMWSFPKGQYDSEKELGVDWTDSDIVIKVITKVEDNKLDNAKEIAKEYNLKTEYIGPNNTIGKSNEMLKIYIPMDAPSPFDEKRMKEWEEKVKSFKDSVISEGFESIAKAKEAIANDEELQAKLDSLGWLLSYINIDYDAIVKDFKYDEDHIISEDTVKRNEKWVNKGKDGTHGTFKTKKAVDAQRKAMFANGYKESLENDDGWSPEIIEVCADLLQDMDTLSYAIRNNVRDSAGEGNTTNDLADTLRALADEALRTADNLEYDSEKLDESKVIKESVSHSFNIGDTFQNINKTFVVDDIKGDYTLVHSDDLKFMPYIVAWNLSDDGSWGQGHYFKTREEAEEYLSKE